jgi:hypothetical protein
VNTIAAIEHPLTIAEIFDLAVVLCVRKWQVVVILCVLDALPGILERAANGGHFASDDRVFWGVFAVETLVSSVVYAALVRAFAASPTRVPAVAPLGGALRDAARSVGAYVVLLLGLTVGLGLVGGLAFLGFVTGQAFGGIIGALAASVAVGLPLLVLVVPFFAVIIVAYPTTILGALGPFSGLAIAYKRVLGSGIRRSWLLGAALLVGSVGPTIAIELVSAQVANVPRFEWARFVDPLLSSLVEGAFGTALATVAAIDLRLRAEGTDLQSSLNQAASA